MSHLNYLGLVPVRTERNQLLSGIFLLSYWWTLHQAKLIEISMSIWALRYYVGIRYDRELASLNISLDEWEIFHRKFGKNRGTDGQLTDYNNWES